MKFRTRHGNIASVLDENYRDGPGDRRPAGRLRAQSPHVDRGLLDRRVFDRIRGALQSLDRPASQPAQHSRRRGADHHEPAGDRRGARLLHRLPHRRHLLRPPDPNRSLQPLHQARPPRAGQAIRKASVPPQAQGHRRQRCGGGPRSGSPWRLVHLGPTRTGHGGSAGCGGRDAFTSRNRSRTSVGWPTRTTSWNFRGKRRPRSW